MLRKQRIQSMEKFIENPSIKKAVEVVHSENISLCVALDDRDRPCEGCVWDPVCCIGTANPDKVTDAELSAMVLDAMQLLAVYEAEHD